MAIAGTAGLTLGAETELLRRRSPNIILSVFWVAFSLYVLGIWALCKLTMFVFASRMQKR